MKMTWRDLLFAHWPVEPDALRPLLPPGLTLDTFDNTAWLGVIPFRMTGVRPRFLPPVPTSSHFCELNVRTYVTDGSKPGVWFFSLDAESTLAVHAARLSFHLNYQPATMRCQPEGANAHAEVEGKSASGKGKPDPSGSGSPSPTSDPSDLELQASDFNWTRYESRRLHRKIPGSVWQPQPPSDDVPPKTPADFTARYRPTGDPFHAQPSTLEHFLTERYCLYAADRSGRLFRGEIHHHPWPLQHAEAHIPHNTMAAPLSPATSPLSDATASTPHLLYAHRLDVLAWAPRRL